MEKLDRERKITPLNISAKDMEGVNIPKRLYLGCEIPEAERARLDAYVDLWSLDEKKTTADHGLIFHSQKVPSKLPPMYLAYVLMKLMRRRRLVYMISSVEIEQIKDQDRIEFLCSREILGITQFPLQQDHYRNLSVTVLERILLKRYEDMRPSLFASVIPMKSLFDHFKMLTVPVQLVMSDYNQPFQIQE